MRSGTKRLPVALAYAGVVTIWSTTPLAIKWSGEGVGFALGVSLRMLIGAVLALLLVLLVHGRLCLSLVALQTYLAAAVGIFGAMTAVYWGSQYIPSGLISVVFGISPMIVSLLAWFWLPERRLDAFKWLGMGLGLGGLALVFRQQFLVGSDAVSGVLAVLLAVSLHSFSAVWIKRIKAGLPALMVTSGGLLFSLPPFAVLFCLVDFSWPAVLPQRALASILYLAVMGSVVGFVLYFYVLERLSAATVAMITLLAPIAALLIGNWLNGEIVGSRVWLGTFLVLLGLVLHIWGLRLFAALSGRLP